MQLSITCFLFYLLAVLLHISPTASIPSTTNLFSTVLGKSSSEINAKVNAAWNHFFVNSNTKLYFTVGTDMAYILDSGSNDVRTEGMSYGMMICVQLNKQSYFNRLWKFAKTKMQHKGDVSSGYFAWSVKPDTGEWKDPGSAPDGEEYFVAALFLAAARWGNSGTYNYEAEANLILDAMINLPSNYKGITKMFDPTYDLIVFAPIGGAALFTDPSYHLPAFYTMWSKEASKASNRRYMAEVATKSRNFLKKTSSKSKYGIFPDYANWDGTPRTGNGDHHHFQWDAFRVVMNIGIDYAWFRADNEMVTVNEKILDFFRDKGSKYNSLWDIDGNAQSPYYQATGHVACNAAGTLAVKDNTLKTFFLNQLWNTNPPTGTYRYYDGMLYMLSLLAVTGNFKYYGGPATVAAEGTAAGEGAMATGMLTGMVVVGVVAVVVLVALVVVIVGVVRKKNVEMV